MATIKICDFCGKRLDSGENVSFTLHNDILTCAPEPKINTHFDLCKECSAKFIDDIIRRTKND